MNLWSIITAFEPCFGVDYYGLDIPYPVDKLPYELTSYAFRELSWSPAQTMKELKQKMRIRYCGPEGSPQLVDDIIYLRSFAIEGNWTLNTSSTLTKLAGEMVGYDGKPLTNQTLAGALAAAKNYNKSDRKITFDRLGKQLTSFRVILAEHLPKMDAIEARCRKLLALTRLVGATQHTPARHAVAAPDEAVGRRAPPLRDECEAPRREELDLAQDAPLSNHLGIARHGGGGTSNRGLPVPIIEGPRLV